MYKAIEQRFRKALRRHIHERYKVDVPIVTERPPKLSMGESASPVCFELAKRLKKAPRALAQEIANSLPPIEGIARVEVAGGGYLNAFFDRAAFFRGTIVETKTAGETPAPQNDAPKVIVEHTSVNPNKAAHIGHLRNAVLGDTFARVLRHVGRRVEVQNYIDNTGVQVADVVLGFLHLEKKSVEEVRALTGQPRFDYYCWDLYTRVTQFLAEDKARLELRGHTLKEIEEDRGDAAKIAEIVSTAIVRRHLQTLDRLGIEYDLLSRESEILHLKFWDAAFAMLKERGAIQFATSGKNAGCWVMELPGSADAGASGAKAPDGSGAEMSELKLRPPKEQTETAGEASEAEHRAPKNQAEGAGEPRELKPATAGGLRASKEQTEVVGEASVAKLRASKKQKEGSGEAPGLKPVTGGGLRPEDQGPSASDEEKEEPAELAEAKIIVRSNGTVTYVGKDIAYHLWKFGLLGRDFHYKRFHFHDAGIAAGRDAEHTWVTTTEASKSGAPPFGHAREVVNVIDSRQAYPQQVVVAGLRALGYTDQADNLKHFSYNVVALTPRCALEMGYEIPPEDAKRPYIEVSGRKGQGVKADDLIDQLEASARKEVDSRHSDSPEHERAAIAHAIAIGALRYFLLRFTRSTVIAFDFKDALSFEGETGPYAQYAVVRVNGILRKAADNVTLNDSASLAGIEAGETDVSRFISAPAGDDLWELILLAGSLDARVDAAVAAQEPAFLTRYAFEMAQAFNVFYHKHHILSEEDAGKRAFLLRLTSLVREQLVAALDLMGITAPEKM